MILAESSSMSVASRCFRRASHANPLGFEPAASSLTTVSFFASIKRIFPATPTGSGEHQAILLSAQHPHSLLRTTGWSQNRQGARRQSPLPYCSRCVRRRPFRSTRERLRDQSRLKCRGRSTYCRNVSIFDPHPQPTRWRGFAPSWHQYSITRPSKTGDRLGFCP